MTFDSPGRDLIPDATVDERDARVAQTILDAWLGPTPETPWSPLQLAASIPELRGIVMVAVADVRAAGVLEGYRAGKREALALAQSHVLEALEDLQ